MDPDRLTALEATPLRVRPALSALWNLDLAFADIVATTSQPALGAIRMAWWRERLEELDAGQARAEPRLQAVAAELLPRGITGAALSKLEDGWLPLLEPFPWGEAQADGLRERGRTLFAVGAHILGGKPSDAEPAGALWSLVDGAAHCSDPDSRNFLCSEARMAAGDMPNKVPANVRPLTVLGALAAYDLQPGGRLGRVGVALAHRLKGTIPHG